MHQGSSQQISVLLSEWGDGDTAALEQLMPLVYDELRKMARHHMRRQPVGHTFQTTDLIHEAYLKLANREGAGWQNRAHFFAVASTAMRHILVDYARSKQSQKRGGWQERVTLNDDFAAAEEQAKEILALDDALQQLAKLDDRKSRIVEMKYFAGITNDQIAEVLKVSPETVKRDWRFARTWLLRELGVQKP
ncbi:MAG: sigma-70 family RNA polymerase sigma factor [Acidobacteria bacterium]|nr:sigma-70 family RNA polymerase sigma factor [Acidobacteriota bacterium]